MENINIQELSIRQKKIIDEKMKTAFNLIRELMINLEKNINSNNIMVRLHTYLLALNLMAHFDSFIKETESIVLPNSEENIN